jgi:hypothetical protein
MCYAAGPGVSSRSTLRGSGNNFIHGGATRMGPPRSPADLTSPAPGNRHVN